MQKEVEQSMLRANAPHTKPKEWAQLIPHVIG